MPELQTPRDIEIARKEIAKKTESARFVNDQEGVCPICKEQMTQSFAMDIPVYVCLNHNLVQAIRNRSDV